MKSALTAAMGSDSGTTAPPTAQSLEVDDVQCFPSLWDLKRELDVVETQRQAEVLQDISSATPIGSMPKFDSGTSMFDYDVNPRSRRGGQEISSSFKSGFAAPYMSATSLQTEILASSLGPDMSHESLKDMRNSLGMSPTVALLKELPSEKISGRTGEAKKLRRNVLRGAILVFVTAGYSGKRFIYERAKELGVRSVILDSDDSWSKTLVDEGMVEKFIPVDFSDVDASFEACMEAIKKVKSDLGDVDGILTFCEVAVPLASRLSEVFGLPGNSCEAVDNARNKHNTRTIMQKAGLPTPKNFLVKEAAQLEEAASHVGFPAVLKPIHGAASLGVIRCNNFDELAKAHTRVAKELRSARIVAGAIEEGEDEAGGNAGGWICLDMILEEYLDGPEVDCDLVFSEGKCVYGIIADNWPTVEPYFNETGSNCPSILPMHQQKELLVLSAKTVQALGFNCGVFHVEGKYTSRGPRLIEVNCRMGGGPIRSINLLVWGVDLVEEQLLCSVGIPSRPQAAPKPLRCIAEFSVNAMKSGILKHTDYLGNWVDHPDVLYARPIVPPGGKVVCVDDGMPTWVCEMMVEKETVEEAIEFVKEMERDIQAKLPIE
mmetsp:Transcript_30006/g.71495  ORF Transcript_30006/g.71495 Transcript_30006/m.71495 type:complete len:603 (+) Transcript_30006:197-2005(+)